MKNIKNELVQTKRLTSGEGNCFFGYYDIPAWSKNEKYHLYHRVDFWERPSIETDVAQLGVIDVSNGKFNALAQTTRGILKSLQSLSLNLLSLHYSCSG